MQAALPANYTGHSRPTWAVWYWKSRSPTGLPAAMPSNSLKTASKRDKDRIARNPVTVETQLHIAAPAFPYLPLFRPRIRRTGQLKPVSFGNNHHALIRKRKSFAVLAAVEAEGLAGGYDDMLVDDAPAQTHLLSDPDALEQQ